MPTTYLILASALPAIQGPGSARIIGDASTDPAATFGAKQVSSGSQAANTFPRKFNQNALEIDYAIRAGSPLYGVIEGLGFSDSGLTLTVATGKATVDGIIELSVATGATLTNATNRIWLKRDGTLEVRTDTTTPALPACYLGVVIASAGAVTSYDLSGVLYHGSGLPRRRTGDTGAPSDTPTTTAQFLTRTVTGTYLWDGSAYFQLVGDHLRQPVNVEALTGTLTLDNTSPNIQRLTAASGQKVLLPSNASSDLAMWFRICNDNAGGGASLTLKDSTDSTTIATIAPQEYVEVFPYVSAGSPAWPSSLTPASIPS